MSKSRDDEGTTTGPKRAVKTTIVGGQRQENARTLAPVPVGIEQLLSIAAVSSEFADALRADRSAAIAAAALELTPTEARILGAIDDGTLQRMVASAAGSVPDHHRRAFLSRSAAALLALAGGAAVAGASACGNDGESPGKQPPAPQPQEVPPVPQPQHVPPPPVTGVRPDRPEPPQPPPDAAPEPPDAGRIPPKEPRPTRGIRPDRPEFQGRGGARPDRPRPTRGIRPDRPLDEDLD